MDRATPHTSQLTQKFIESQQRLHVFYLPPYSPTWNPDEKVWNHLKCQELKSHQAKSKDELKMLTKNKLKNMSNNPRLLRGIYFRCCVADFLQWPIQSNRHHGNAFSLGANQGSLRFQRWRCVHRSPVWMMQTLITHLDWFIKNPFVCFVRKNKFPSQRAQRRIACTHLSIKTAVAMHGEGGTIRCRFGYNAGSSSINPTQCRWAKKTPTKKPKKRRENGKQTGLHLGRSYLCVPL